MEFSRDKKLKELISKENNHLIKVITGIRRCGKSYLLFKIFKNHLLSRGVAQDHIIEFAFDFGDDLDKLDDFLPEEETRLQGKENRGDYHVNARKFRAYIKSVTGGEGQYYILLDEVQRLQDFAETLNGFLRYDNLDVYVTGSNSKFLSSDIATEFRGRGDVVSLLPLTLAEIHEAFGGDKSELLEDYLRYGGLPLCVLANGAENKEKYLALAYETVYERDILERNGVRNPHAFRALAEVVASGIGSLTNPDRIAKTFKSRGANAISTATVQNYLGYLEDAFIIKTARRYNVKGRKYIGAPYKYYFTDLGVRNAIIGFRQFEKTHLMENLIYNELIARGYNVDVGVVEKFTKNNGSSYSKRNYEIDFVANIGSQTFYIQSAYTIEDEAKKHQEEMPLSETADNFQKIIITFDKARPYYNKDGILIMGLLDFLTSE